MTPPTKSPALGEGLRVLAGRVEAAGGADRELDCLIYEARNPIRTLKQRGTRDGEPTGEYFDYVGDGQIDIVDTAPAYTASLDAAMGLVPEGADFTIDRLIGDGSFPPCNSSVGVTERKAVSANAATPALALTAASLRAIAALVEGDGE